MDKLLTDAFNVLSKKKSLDGVILLGRKFVKADDGGNVVLGEYKDGELVVYKNITFLPVTCNIKV